MDVKIISAYDHPREVGQLFSEYTAYVGNGL